MRAVDLFAGWGGFSLGATQAGVDVLWAGNHWPLAVEVHAANHARTQHVCQDLRQADWTSLPPYDLLLAAPACQGHSTASQGQRSKRHDALRATAWAVVDCVEVTEPRCFIVENVPAFRRWKLYPLWRQALELLGYRLTEATITASHVGVPQRRRRWFMVGARGSAVRLSIARSPETAFASAIDPDAAGWRPVSAAKRGAQARIAAGRRKHGRRFLTQHVTGHSGVSLDEPIRTITAKDQWALVDGSRYRPLTTREIARGMGFPDSYTWPEASRANVIRGLGNAVCPPVARALVEQVVDPPRAIAA